MSFVARGKIRKPRGKTRRYTALSVVAGLLIIAILSITIARVANVVKEALPAKDNTYYVSPTGDNSRTGKEKDKPIKTIQLALDRAQPGDAIHLEDGAYYQSFSSVRSGKKKAPITITGSKNAIVFGSQSRVIQIHHSFLTLDGFQINGQWADGDSKDDFRDKLIYVIGTKVKKGVEGLRLTNLLVQNAGGECIRLRYFAKHNEISHSTIRNCGIFDFRFADGGKNGEGIYIGTAPEQLKDGKNPTADPDKSTDNYIHHNLIETYGNECVDVKEAAFQNLIEYNTCRYQKDSESAGLDARGSKNIFRYNTVEDTIGAAIRLGGDAEDDGIDNQVYSNTFRRNAAGLLNIQRRPQGKICGNIATSSDNSESDDDAAAIRPCD